MLIFSGSSNLPLAQKISKKLNLPAGRQGLELSKLDIHIFPDGEKRVRVLDRVVDEDCVVVQPTSNPGDSRYMELFFIVDALKRSGASKITAVIPYLGYQRQDHVFRDGEAVSLKVIVETLERVGVDKVITFDLHSIKIPEVFSIPVVHLSALPLFAEKIRLSVLGSLPADATALQAGRLSDKSQSVFSLSVSTDRQQTNQNLKTENRKPITDFVLVSPDMGGIRRIKIISDILGGAAFAVVDKERDLETGEVLVKEIQGNVKDKTALIIDDIISSGNTIVKAASILLKNGASKVLVFATHPVFSDDSKNILQNSGVEKIYVTDTIYVPDNKVFPKLEIISVSNLIAKELRKN